MPFDSDVALVGTGVAPLIAAKYLLDQGKSVLILNPDWDFFQEDSELPLDPFIDETPQIKRVLKSTSENALPTLRPDFPGALEFWTKTEEKSGFHDPLAPHIRERDRLWILPAESEFQSRWDALENLFVEASDHGLNPQLLEGLSAVHRFPGASSHGQSHRGLLIPGLCDIDLIRYRIGLLEFLRERLETQKLVCAVDQIDWMPGGVRFREGRALRTARLTEGALVFWTPRLTNWVISQARKFETPVPVPRGVRLWEQWSLISRDLPTPHVVGLYQDMAVWADFEGPPPGQGKGPRQLTVLRAGPLMKPNVLSLPETGLSWASSESFHSLSQLCLNFLKWDYTTIRGMKPHAIFEWEQSSVWQLSQPDPSVHVVNGCDGPLIDVVSAAKKACDHLYAAGEKPT